MSAARTSSACCCVCPSPSCCCDCMEVSTDVTITASHSFNRSCSGVYCDGVCDTAGSTTETHLSSFLANGNVKYVQKRNAGNQKREFNSPVPVNDPYGSGRFEGDIACGGSGSGSGEQNSTSIGRWPNEVGGDTFCFILNDASFNYSVVWEQVTPKNNIIVGYGDSGSAEVGRWNYGTADSGAGGGSGYNCGTDDCRLLIDSLPQCFVQVRRTVTGTASWRFYNDSDYDNDIRAGTVVIFEEEVNLANIYPEIIIDIPLGLTMRYPGEYRDCESPLDNNDFQVVSSSIANLGNIFSISFNGPFFSPCNTQVGGGGEQDACDGSISQQDAQYGIWTNVGSDIETGGDCPDGDSRFEDRSAVVNSRATIRHNIINSSLIGIPCPPIP